MDEPLNARHSSRRKWLYLGAASVIALILVTLAFYLRQPPYLAEADLSDGRIFRIEKITFGQKHEAGDPSLLMRLLGPWLPGPLTSWAQPAVPRNTIERNEDVLVVWVNAVNPVNRTNVDCQGIRLDLVSPNGTVYNDNGPNWFGGQKFWRVGHVFRAFPRDAENLQIRLASWKNSNVVEVVLPNPGWRAPASWKALPLPQTNRINGYHVVLRGLTARTNEGSYWRSSTVFWDPAFELMGPTMTPEEGWDLLWEAEDRYGNLGQNLGVKEPMLKFSLAARPSPTNLQSSVLLKAIPDVSLASMTNLWLDFSLTLESNRVDVLGLFPAGVHTFTDGGQYLTNPPVRFAPVRGGGRSGWVTQSRRETPTRTVTYAGHYSSGPVVFVRWPRGLDPSWLGLRLVDPEGRTYAAEPENEGTRVEILPFILRLPAEVITGTLEFVGRPLISAEFVVDTTASAEHSP